MLSTDLDEKKLTSYFSYLDNYVKINNDLSFTDINKSLETFILDLLNLLGLGNFKNCNLQNINYKAIDLYDEEQDIAFQITSEANSNKIKETLKKYENKKVKFFFLKNDYKPRKDAYKDFPMFDVKEDVYTFSKLIKVIKTKKMTKECLDYLEETIILPIDINKINNYAKGYKNYEEKSILNDIKKVSENFVVTNMVTKCLKIIEEENILILIGNPGEGKTYTSKYIVGKFLEKGYKLLYSPNRRLKDVLENYEENNNYILFIDDIFGSTESDFMSTITDEEISSILSFKTNNLKVVINSRTSIFNEVIDNFEKIHRLNLHPFVVESSEFTNEEKARILIRHLKNSNLNKLDICKLFEEKITFINNIHYKRKNIFNIIEHKNFSPRLIELITNKNNIPEDYDFIDFIYTNLNNPYEIYRHSYENNLKKLERRIMEAIYIIANYNNNYGAKIEDIYELVSKIMPLYEIDFKKSLRILKQSFISLFKIKGEERCNFYNPSIADFCNELYKNNKDLKEFIINIDKPQYLNHLLKNQNIPFSLKKEKIIDLRYDNFNILYELGDEIEKDKEIIDYIGNIIFEENRVYTYYSESFFINEKFYDKDYLIEKINKNHNLIEFLLADAFNSNYGKDFVNFIYNNINDFNEITQKKIIIISDCIIKNLYFENMLSFIKSLKEELLSDDEYIDKFSCTVFNSTIKYFFQKFCSDISKVNYETKKIYKQILENFYRVKDDFDFQIIINKRAQIFKKDKKNIPSENKTSSLEVEKIVGEYANTNIDNKQHI